MNSEMAELLELLPNGSNTQMDCDFDKHDWLLVKFIFMSIIGTGVALFGIFGNIVIMAVLTKPSMRTANNLYLTVLALFDTLVLLPAIMLYSLEYVAEYFHLSHFYVTWIELVPYFYALSHFAQTGSVYITLSVTFERYLAVVHPKTAAANCTKHKAAMAIIGVTCFSAVFNCTKLYEIKVAHNDTCSGFASRELVASDLLKNDLYSTIYSLWLTHFIMVFLPFGILLTFNTAIAWNFKRSLRQLAYVGMPINRKQLKEQSRDATRVLVTIVLVFLICNCWGFVTTLMESIHGVGTLRQWAPEFYTFSREVINFLALVNSSINFVICLIFGHDFRRQLMKMFGGVVRCRNGPMSDRIERRMRAPALLPVIGYSPVVLRVPRPSAPCLLRYVDRVTESDEEDCLQEHNQRTSSLALMNAGRHFAIGLLSQDYLGHRQSLPTPFMQRQLTSSEDENSNAIGDNPAFSKDSGCFPTTLRSFGSGSDLMSDTFL